MTGIIVILIIILSLIIIRQQLKKLNISPIELKNRLDRNDSLILIDVRNADEFYGSLGHIQGARLNPLNRIAAWANMVPRNSEPVILICHIGNRSLIAARILSNRGITAYNLRGGMVNWNRHGFPVQHA
jgi:rhodanese-related sulfurtransferase